jgi:UDP-4-amino-4-deoxy-L-arabinose formyltransferase/UDP-glucuronic acid dehydrogenase (UDP-4-keto-hexauronic acid decarboxylating)
VNLQAIRDSIHAFAPDILLSFSCPYRIRRKLLAIPRIGCLNVHSSLLPAYAGVCTYIHVLARREMATGVTVHEMVDRFDAGRIVAQARLDIPSGVSTFRLFSRQCTLAGDLLPGAIRACLEAGTIVGRQQDLESRSYFGEPTAADIRQLRANGYCLLAREDWPRLFTADPGNLPPF